MSPEASEWLNMIFRWVHVIAGVMWIGHLYFFNFVNSQVAKTYDADSKKKVVPELMPRALYWFRWGAAYTWFSGILLLGVVYYMGGYLFEGSHELSVGMGSTIGLAVLVIGFVIYDLLWNSPLKNNALAGTVVSIALVSAVAWGLQQIFSPRAVFIHIGALMGTSMAANVWMRIWPAQKKIIAAIKAGQAPDKALAATAGLRSKHNTYMSVPLILLMLSNHFQVALLGANPAWAYIAGILVVGFLLTRFLYGKAASAAPAQY